MLNFLLIILFFNALHSSNMFFQFISNYSSIMIKFMIKIRQIKFMIKFMIKIRQIKK